MGRRVGTKLQTIFRVSLQAKRRLFHKLNNVIVPQLEFECGRDRMECRRFTKSFWRLGGLKKDCFVAETPLVET